MSKTKLMLALAVLLAGSYAAYRFVNRNGNTEE